MLKTDPESACTVLRTTTEFVSKTVKRCGVIPATTTVCAPPHDVCTALTSESKLHSRGVVSPKHSGPSPNLPKSPLPQHASNRWRETRESLTMRRLLIKYSYCVHRLALSKPQTGVNSYISFASYGNYASRAISCASYAR